MKKVLKWSFIFYLFYGLVMTWYLLYGSPASVPMEFKGTAADPSTFMNDRQLELSSEYSRIRYLIFFLLVPLEWLLLAALLVLGISKRFRIWAEQISSNMMIRCGIYVFWYTIALTIIFLPIQWISYTLSKNYGIAASSFPVWMKDQLIGFWLEYVLMAVIVFTLFILIRKATKRWWLYAWLLSVPFTLFLLFLKPVVIDPIYNDFYPLQNKQLEAKILDLADQANIEANRVYEVNMSEKTNALNAYVTGIGSNSRIVLWDTTLEKLSEDGVLFIMAHEMAHYVKNHVLIGVSSYLLLSLLGFFITAKLFRKIVNRWGEELHIKSMGDLAALPLILLLFSVLSFSISPFSNAFSRYQEHTADQYAIELTENKEAAIQSFQALTISGLSEVNPPVIVKWFRYGHPTMLERISFIEKFEKD